MGGAKRRGMGRCLVIMPSPRIEQQQLDRLQMLKNQLAAIRQELREYGASIFSRLESGSETEPGSHRIAIETRHHGTRTERLLVLNGVPLED